MISPFGVNHVEVTIFASELTERQVVEIIAEDFEILREKFPKTIDQLNACVPTDIRYTLTTEEVIRR